MITKSHMRKFVRPTTAVLLLLATILAVTGQIDRFAASCGLGAINDSNEQYLTESFDKSLKGFLVLSGIKSGVAVLEGSSIGVGFNLEVGDLVQSIYDYVDVAWRTALAGSCVLLLMRLVLQTVQAVDHWFLSATAALSLAVFLAWWILPQNTKQRRWLKECLLFIASITLALYVILPVSIAGASYLSKKITRPLVEEAQAGFESLESDLTAQALNERLFPEGDEDDESFWSRFDFKAKLENSKQAIVKMGDWLTEITTEFATWTVKLIAGYIFDCIIFPLAFFVVVYVLTRGLLTYLLGISRSRSMREDFEAVLGKYYGKKGTRGEAEPEN